MSVVTLQLGQCGTQIGQALFDCLAAETESDQGPARSPLDVFFRPVDERSPRTKRNRRHARAVLVDMEPKVINKAIVSAAHSASDWCYPANSSFSQQSGSGNNWARGYNSYGPKFASTVCELVRREAEQADYLGGFLLLQSMAGGTGAGLGTYVAEAIRDTFPSSFLMNHCIWPYQSGEVIVQNYNSLLTLAHLAEISDGIILMENSALHTACQRLLNIQRPSFNDLNGVAARSITSSLLPACYRPAAGGTSQQGKQVTLFGDIIEKVCCHPAYRLLSLRALPQMPPASLDFTTFTWPPILRRLRQMQVTGSVVEEGLQWNVKVNGSDDIRSQRINKSLAAMLTLRGQGARQADVSMFSHPGLYTPWAVQPLTVASAADGFANCEMSASLLSNDQTCMGLIRPMQDKAYKMYNAGAYLHQYKQFGIDKQDFDSCFARIEDTYASYQAL
ncbi:hypothetical protein WJX82_001857 [Trebouxia sp. C0006]